MEEKAPSPLYVDEASPIATDVRFERWAEDIERYVLNRANLEQTLSEMEKVLDTIVKEPNDQTVGVLETDGGTEYLSKVALANMWEHLVRELRMLNMRFQRAVIATRLGCN